jgi:hypothetical protein
VNVHHGDEAETPRMTKRPLPGMPNVEVDFMTFSTSTATRVAHRGSLLERA